MNKNIVELNLDLINDFIAFSPQHSCVINKIDNLIAIIQATIRKKDNSVIKSSNKIATLPLGFRPKHFIDTPVEVTTIDGSVGGGRLHISTDGNIYFSAYGDKVSTFGFILSFI